MEILRLSTEHVDGAAVVVRLRGELDVATTPELKRMAADLVRRGHNRLIFDLSELTFIDSTGIGAIVGVQRRVREAHGSLVLRAVPARVRSVLTVVGLDRVVEIERDPIIDLTSPEPALR